MSWTISRYLGLHTLSSLGVAFGAFAGLVFLINFVELLRRAGGKEAIEFSDILLMAVFQMPVLTEKIIPFAVLFGAMASFLALSRHRELVVARASGMSVWQFLAPSLAVAFLAGVVAITLYNPIASTFAAQFKRMENQFFKGQSSLIAVEKTGLWLRQGEAETADKAVIHALQVAEDGIHLNDVIIFLYDTADVFAGRIDAPHAVLKNGYWELTDAVRHRPGRSAERFETYRLDTPLTARQIEESFAAPDSISFWSLPGFIETAEAAGFAVLRHRLHWHALLATPFLLCAMVLVAATFSLRNERFGGIGYMVLGCVIAGFLLYFLSDLSLALGVSGIIPVIMAAWAPAGITLLLGVSMLLHLEDG